jgi:hypothetical protein
MHMNTISVSRPHDEAIRSFHAISLACQRGIYLRKSKLLWIIIHPNFGRGIGVGVFAFFVSGTALCRSHHRQGTQQPLVWYVDRHGLTEYESMSSAERTALDELCDGRLC